MKSRTLFIFFLLWSWESAWADSGTQSLIHVTGVAEKYVEPNMVIVNLEVYGKSEQAKLAQERQANEFRKVKNVIEKYKIKKDDFATTDLSLQPETRYDEKTRSNKTVGYRVSHQLSIVLRQKNEIGSLLDSLVTNAKTDASGININSISWDNDGRKAIAQSLINDAVSDAKKKADQLASAAGVKIKGVQTISYEANNISSALQRESVMMFKSAAPGINATELEAGAVKVRTQVSLQYIIN